LIALLLAVASPGAADERPAPAADPRIAAELKALNDKFEITDDRDYRLVFEIGDGQRTQLVIVNSNTEFFDKVEIRDVWSTALLVSAPLDAALAERLLKANDTLKLGAWRVWPAQSKGDSAQAYIVFAAQIDANASQEMLAAALAMVAQTADALEKEITGADAR
jgi:hypothetical protein